MGVALAKPHSSGARVPPEIYETLCRAAELTRTMVNQFLMQSIRKEAPCCLSISRCFTIAFDVMQKLAIKHRLILPPDATPAVKSRHNSNDFPAY